MRGKIKRALAGLFVLLLALCLSAGLYVGLKGYGMYREALEQKPLAEMAEQVRAQPDFTPLDELPRLYRDAVVAVEDHRFYSHGGVDFIALCRALWNDVCAGAFVEGGSTITQQLAKNLYFTQEKVLTRKAAEAFMAWAIEKQYTKDEILELYVNSIYFGSGYYNVRQASEGYFGKEYGKPRRGGRAGETARIPPAGFFAPRGAPLFAPCKAFLPLFPHRNKQRE